MTGTYTLNNNQNNNQNKMSNYYFNENNNNNQHPGRYPPPANSISTFGSNSSLSNSIPETDTSNFFLVF
jgi:hypothetical protein